MISEDQNLSPEDKSDACVTGKIPPALVVMSSQFSSLTEANPFHSDDLQQVESST
jgi:hypothetical protein